MILLALLLAACGSDDKSESTEVATTVAGIATEASTEAAVETSTVDVIVEEATVAAAGASSSVATAVAGGMATPAAAGLPPSAVASPAASPVAATPVTGADVAPVAIYEDADEATPAAVTAVTLSGTVVLPGTVNEAWVLTDAGCVGLGTHGDLRAGRQLVVRDAEGAIVGVTELEPSNATDACEWTFSLDVPESPFYAVSIPMVVERIFTQQEVEQSDGEIVVPVA
jgi:hypothetical protein